MMSPDQTIASIAAEVHDEWVEQGKMHVVPDDTTTDPDVEFWDEVERRRDDLMEGAAEEKLHPRDRRGRWVKKLKALKPGEHLQGEMKGITAVRVQSGSILHPGYGTFGQGALSDTEEQAADAMMLPDAQGHGGLSDPAEFQRFLDTFSHGDITAVLESAQVGDYATTYAGKLIDGAPAGEFNLKGEFKLRVSHKRKLVDFDDLIVYERGAGTGTAFWRWLRDGLGEHGIEKVTLTAGMTVGGYMWAREGFGFRTYASDEDPDRAGRSQAASLLRSRFDSFAFNADGDFATNLIDDPEFPDEVPPNDHVTDADLEDFMGRFAATDPKARTAREIDDYTEAHWDEDMERGVNIHGDPFFTSPQEIAMYGIENAWTEEYRGEPVQMWLGKRLLLHAKWDGEYPL